MMLDGGYGEGCWMEECAWRVQVGVGEDGERQSRGAVDGEEGCLST